MFSFWTWDIYTIGWLAWLGLFFVIELPAAWESYHNHPGGTLSEHVWAWLGSGQDPRFWVRMRRWGFMLLWVVLTAHFFFQWA